MRKAQQMVFIVGLGFGLLQYQNCSSVSSHLLSNSVALANDAGSLTNDEKSQLVGVINPISVGSIFFPESSVSVVEDQPLTLTGVCEQDGSMIGWSLHKGEAPIERGLAGCDQGAFQITMNQQWQDHCGGESLKLSAALGAKASAEVEISVPCSDDSESLKETEE